MNDFLYLTISFLGGYHLFKFFMDIFVNRGQENYLEQQL